jgi:hypothetical protein
MPHRTAGAGRQLAASTSPGSRSSASRGLGRRTSAGFRQSADFKPFLEAARPFFNDIEEMTHYEVTAKGLDGGSTT